MLICRVTGSVIATRKNEKLTGCKFVVVEPIAQPTEQPPAQSSSQPIIQPPEQPLALLSSQPIIQPPGRIHRFVAVDNIGAGIGETVLIAFGGAARLACGVPDLPADAAIVGIVDA